MTRFGCAILPYLTFQPNYTILRTQKIPYYFTVNQCCVYTKLLVWECRLSWLTNSALVYEPKCGGSCGVSANEVQYLQLYAGAQINFGDLTPYLTNGWVQWLRFVLDPVLVYSRSGFTESKSGSGKNYP